MQGDEGMEIATNRRFGGCAVQAQDPGKSAQREFNFAEPMDGSNRT